MKEFVISEVKAETAVLVGLITKTQDEAKTKEYLDELEFLADTAGAVTVKRFTQKVVAPNQTTYVGKGKLEEIRQYIKDEEEEDSRPHFPDSRYLRHACPDRSRQDPGRTGTVSLHASTLAATLDPLGTSGWWFRLGWRKGFRRFAWTR